MKIFRKENNRDVVYVQMQDIMFIENELDDIAIPASIHIKICPKGVTMVDDSNRFDFVKFDKEPEVDFFKTLNFIIDYNDYKDLTDEQFQERLKNVVDEYNNLVTMDGSISAHYENTILITDGEPEILTLTK